MSTMEYSLTNFGPGGLSSVRSKTAGAFELNLMPAQTVRRFKQVYVCCVALFFNLSSLFWVYRGRC